MCVLEKMLLLDPEQRASAADALELPFFADFRDAEEETEATPYDQTVDNTDLPLEQWKRKRIGHQGAARSSGRVRRFSYAAFSSFCVCAGHTFTEILTFRPPRDSKETSL